MDDFFPALVVVGMIAIVVGGEWLNRRRRRRLTEAWTAFASERGWQLTGSYPMFCIEGTVSGIKVGLLHTEHIGGKGSRYYTHQVYARPAGSLGELSVRPRGLLSKLLSSGQRDGLEVQGGSLRPEVHQALLAFPEATISDGALRVDGTGVAEPGTCDPLFRRLAEIAAAFDR